MNHLPGFDNAPDRSLTRYGAIDCHRFCECCRSAMHWTSSQLALLEQSKVRKTGFTDPGRLNQARMDHARQIALRTADDPEHVGGRRLLLQRFTQLAEQPRVLDGDDG